MNEIISNDFKTPLGTVQSIIKTDLLAPITNPNNFEALTSGHRIILETFELDNDWLPNKMNIETSYGWRWFIEKTNSTKENLFLYCNLKEPVPELNWGIDTGERLDALYIQNQNKILHIGTEDTDSHQERAFNGDWMPKRFEERLTMRRPKKWLQRFYGNYWIWNFVECIDFGFKIYIPDLYKGEKIYFHYLIATNTIKRSEINPDEEDISTWYAVGQSKYFLDNKLK